MSIKQNITSLQDLLERVNALPETENLDEEISTQSDLISEQDAKIAELAEILASKAGGGGSEPILQDKTITPTTSQQTVTADSDYDGLNTVTVNAIPSTYVKPSVTKSATTYTPTTTNQTIAAGTYCSGVQTIKGDANLIPANIVSGKSIFGVTGSAVGGSSGGSASYDTCTLQINNESGYPYKLAYTSVENGKIVAKYSNTSASTSIICLCGSTLCCYKYGSLVSSSITQLGDIGGGGFNSVAYRIDASANETIIATIYGGGSIN